MSRETIEEKKNYFISESDDHLLNLIVCADSPDKAREIGAEYINTHHPFIRVKPEEVFCYALYCQTILK